MKHNILWTACIFLTAAPLAVWAQPANNTNYNNNNNSNAGGSTYWENARTWGPHKGSREVTLGGSGTSNRRLNDSLGGASLSLGSYYSDTLEILLRQTVDYTNPSPGGQAWDGSTKLALDQHILPFGSVRPFVGVNLGGIYGKRVRDTWAAGLEGGAKIYTLSTTFIYADAEYDWFFRHAPHALGSKFNDGQWNWNVGLGYDF